MDRLQQIAERHRVSPEAVEQVYQALSRTGGKQAQFSHADLGGMGQWMPGMIMVGRMGDTALKAKVDALCAEVAALLATQPVSSSAASEKPSGREASDWWTPSLGRPNSAGSQNGIRYAYFAAANRLAIELNGVQRLYDTTGYRIHGVSQQQSDRNATLTFTSDRGPVRLEDLPSAE
jgi:hypothetical protein